MNTEQRRFAGAPVACCLMLLITAAHSLRTEGPSAILWTAPGILFASLVIAWGAESAQFFIAQGFALAILAWLQTLPEFAVEAVLAWKQLTPFLLANLTGALRMLTGLGWPMIYFSAAFVHRRRTKTPLRKITLDIEHSVNVVGLLVALAYISFVLWRGSLNLIDAAVLTAIYAGYLTILRRMPPRPGEEIDDLEMVPRTIVKSPRWRRITLITACFLIGGALIYFTAEPFVSSLLAIGGLLGISSFVLIQWVAPFVSEFPEMLSTFYFARTVTGAPMALMNMVSSNINQWTLLVAMLPVALSLSIGAPSALAMDPEQKLELLLTIAQAALGMMFLIDMVLAWWEAAGLFVLWLVQFVFSAMKPQGTSLLAVLGGHMHWWVTIAYFVWAGIEVIRLITGRRSAAAFVDFGRMWRMYVRRRPA